jgi:RNA polymerase sigma factor (sigma-70 family)
MVKTQLSQWLEELQGGNNACLQWIFENHGAYCISMLKRKTNCTDEDAEDIFVESVINFREKMLAGKIESLTHVRNYLFTTCHNMYLARNKKLGRERAQVSEVERFFYSYLEDDDALEYKAELSEVSVKALATLGDKCRQIIQLYYLDGLSMDAVAARMGLANRNVAKVSKSRCLQQLMVEVKRLSEKIMGNQG